MCEEPQAEELVRASGMAKVGLCSDFREKWESLEDQASRNNFLSGLALDEDYVDIEERFAFHVKTRMDFVSMNSSLSDPVLTDDITDMATIFVDVSYNVCHPDFADDEEGTVDVIESVLYEWIFNDLSFVCSLREIAPYNLGIVVSAVHRPERNFLC